MMRSTTFGMTTSAVADNRLAAATLGHSPHRIAALNWVLGSALAGLAGALIVPITGLGVTPLTLLVVPAFAAALLGGFSSFSARSPARSCSASGRACSPATCTRRAAVTRSCSS